MPRASRASSRAWVQEVVSSTRCAVEQRGQPLLDPLAEGPVSGHPAGQGAAARTPPPRSRTRSRQSAMGRAVTGADYGISEAPHIGP